MCHHHRRLTARCHGVVDTGSAKPARMLCDCNNWQRSIAKHCCAEESPAEMSAMGHVRRYHIVLHA